MHEIARHLLGLHRGERDGVLAAHVGDDRHVDAEESAVAQRAVGVGLDDALIGEHCARVHVDADELGADSRGDAQGRPRVVLQHVEAQARARKLAPNLGGHDAHGRHGGGLDAAGREGRVAEILDQERVDAAVDERPGVGQRRGDHVAHRAGPPRTAGQGDQVHHADDRALESHQR
jgi:hypothetical protein